MMRQPACIHGASSRLLGRHGVARDLHELCKQAACSKFELWRGLMGTCGGAYGVVGFSGVKDARKSVLAADALRRLTLLRLGHHLDAITGQILDKSWTNTGRMQCKYWTFFDPLK